MAGGKKYSKDLEQGELEISAKLTISNTTRKITDVMKEKLRSTEESTVNQNSFRAEYFVYYKLL